MQTRCPKCGLFQGSKHGISLRYIFDTPEGKCPCGASLVEVK